MSDLLALEIARRNFYWDALWSKNKIQCQTAPTLGQPLTIPLCDPAEEL